MFLLELLFAEANRQWATPTKQPDSKRATTIERVLSPEPADGVLSPTKQRARKEAFRLQVADWSVDQVLSPFSVSSTCLRSSVFVV